MSLYIYDRRRAADGLYTPVWTMFQADEDYITLARRDDGSTRWRTAAFERLGNDYYFVNRCAFYSVQDEQRVCNFFRNYTSGGIEALTCAQQAVLDRRCAERRRERDKKVRARMKGLPALPRGLGRWLRRDVMPAYFLYGHAKGGKATGVCSSCGHEAVLNGVKHNAKAVCPRCGRELTMKSRGRMGKITDRETVQVIQRAGPDELIVRIIKVISDVSEIKVWENARQFISLTPDGTFQCDSYYDACDSGRPHWKQGERPVFYLYGYNFYADTCGHVYCDNLPDAMAGTPWEYCPVKLFCEHFRERMVMVPFLKAHLEHPRLEHLVKTGFFSLAADLVYGYASKPALDETQNRTHRILRVAAEDVALLRELDVNASTLTMFQGYSGVKDRQRLLRWQLENSVTHDVGPLLEHMTAHKLMQYVTGQYAALGAEDGHGRYNNMQAVVSEYRDYADMCVKLEYDMGNSFVLYPKDLQKAHDKAQERIKAEADAQLRRDFQEAMRAIAGHLDYEAEGMRILLPANPEELAAEGNALHHCVGGYADRIAKHECIILFLRQCEDVEKPFFTIEVRGGKVAQVRGMRNCPATPEVESFIARWEQLVLHASTAA